MSWLFDNAIANLPGPEFLLLYGIVIALTLAACWWWLRMSDTSQFLPGYPVLSSPDPYETAYLRGGENEVLRIALFHLLQKGCVQVMQAKTGILSGDEQRIHRASKGSGQLSVLEKEILDKIASHSASEIYKDEILLSAVKDHCAHYEQRLKGEHLLAGPELTDKAWQILWTGGLAARV